MTSSKVRLSLLPPSMLALTPLRLLLELPLRFRRASSGSSGCKPVAFANRFSTSVSVTTPFKRPDMCWPGSAEAETEGVAERCWNGGFACAMFVIRIGGCAAGGCAMVTGALWLFGVDDGRLEWLDVIEAEWEWECEV